MQIGTIPAPKDCVVPLDAKVVIWKYCECCGNPFFPLAGSRQRDCWRCIAVEMATGWIQPRRAAEDLGERSLPERAAARSLQ